MTSPVVKEFYEQYGDRIGSFVMARHVRAAELLSECAGGRPVSFLDVGCGAGASTAFLIDHLNVTQAYGVDISEPAVAAARARGIEASVVNLNEEDLPFENGSFDLIFCGELLEHILDIDHLLDELSRCLRPGGAAVFTTANLASWYNRIALVLGWQPYFGGISYRHNVGHPRPPGLPRVGAGRLRSATPRALRELLQAHNFHVAKLQTVPYLEGPLFRSGLLRLVHVLDVLGSKAGGLGGDIVAVAEKR